MPLCQPLYMPTINVSMVPVKNINISELVAHAMNIIRAAIVVKAIIMDVVLLEVVAA